MVQPGQALGAKSFPPPYLAPNTQSDALNKGINYASGASGILDETGHLFVSTLLARIGNLLRIKMTIYSFTKLIKSKYIYIYIL